jgi:tRNA-specific adenosine deaminase 1
MGDAVAQAVLAQFVALPKTGKPQPHEHTVLAGIALSLPGGNGGSSGSSGARAGQRPAQRVPDSSQASLDQQQERQEQEIEQQQLAVVAIGTGTKCLGASKRLPGGVAANDCHAEVLCRRALLRWLYREMQQAVQQYRQAAAASQQAGSGSAHQTAGTCILRLVPPPQLPLLEGQSTGGTSADGPAAGSVDLFGGWRFALQPGVQVHMYVSQPPCGDASILGPVPAQLPGQLTAACSQHGGYLASASPAAEGAAAVDGAGSGGAGFGRTGAKPLKRQRVGDDFEAQQADPLPASGQQQQQQPEQDQKEGQQWGLPQQYEVETYAEAQAVGLVRRKPGRGDATLSMACSDKLARWCLLGLQASALQS